MAGGGTGKTPIGHQERTMRRVALLLTVVVAVLIVAGLVVYVTSGPRSGEVQDEAMRVGRGAASFTAAGRAADGTDYFADVDNGAAFTDAEIKGRNIWLVWTGGN